MTWRTASLGTTRNATALSAHTDCAWRTAAEAAWSQAETVLRSSVSTSISSAFTASKKSITERFSSGSVLESRVPVTHIPYVPSTKIVTGDGFSGPVEVMTQSL